MFIKWLPIIGVFLAMAITESSAADIDISFYQGHENGPVAGFEKIDREMFKPLLMDDFYYTEVWFHEIQFPAEGIIVIVNLQINNIGLKKHKWDTYITVSDPTSGTLMNRDTIGSNQTKMDKEEFGITIKDHRMRLQDNKYFLKYSGKNIKADFTYHILTGSFQQGDGTLRFNDSDDFLKTNFPIPWAKITGTLTYNGKTLNLTGTGSMNHDRQVLPPSRFMSKWRVFWLYSEDATVGIVRCSSEEMKGTWLQRLMVAEKGRILFSSHNYKLLEQKKNELPGYSMPGGKRYLVEAIHGDNWLKGGITVTRVQEKYDILRQLPYVLRKLAAIFMDKTWTYRFYNHFDFKLHLNGKTRTIRGTGTGNVVEPVKK